MRLVVLAKENARKIANALDLRFTDRGDEALFRDSLEPQLLKRSLIGFLLYGPFIAFRLVFDGSTERIKEELSNNNCRSLAHGVNMLGLAVTTFFIFLVLLRLRTGTFMRGMWEYVLAVAAMFILASFLFRSLWYSAKVMGFDPRECIPQKEMPLDPGAELIIRVSVILTVVSLFVPFRSCILWTLPLFSALVCVSAQLMGPKKYENDLGNMLLLCIFCYAGAHRQEKQVREKWLAQKKVHSQQDLLHTQERAHLNLLDRFCDCLIQVNPDLDIVLADKRFSAMMLFDEKPIQGIMLDYLANEQDSLNLKDAIQKCSLDSGRAEVIPARLKDSQRREFQVHIYCSRFEVVLGQPHYLLGIVETQERTERLPGDFFGDGVVLHSMASTGASIGASQSSVSDTLAELESMSDFDLNDIGVSFLVEPGYPIISLSPGFTALCGPCRADQPLLELLREKDDFSKWVQNICELLNGSGNLHAALTLDSFSGTRSTISCRIEHVSLSQVIIDKRSNGESLVILRVTLKGIHHGKVKMKRTREAADVSSRRRIQSRAKDGNPLIEL